MKPTWVIPAILVAGLAGLGGLTQVASAQDDDRQSGSGQMRGDYGSTGQRSGDDDRRGDDDRGPRWRDRDDDRRGYGSREGHRGGDDCGPRSRGYHERGHGMHHGYGRGREGMDRGYYRREGRGYDSDRGNDSRGDGWREGRRYDRDDSDRGYRGHGHHHRYHQRQEGRHDGRHDGHQDGRGGPGRFGSGFDPARLDSAKKEIGVTAAQEQAWTKYASTLKEVADARKARRDSIDRDAMRQMSTDDHRKFRDAMIEQRRKEQDQLNAAIDGLVGSLDEKQVAIAKEVLPGYAFGGGMRGAGMGWGGGRNR
jgi:hypothetical protein